MRENGNLQNDDFCASCLGHLGKASSWTEVGFSLFQERNQFNPLSFFAIKYDAYWYLFYGRICEQT
jgi:hypothetical protein